MSQAVYVSSSLRPAADHFLRPPSPDAVIGESKRRDQDFAQSSLSSADRKYPVGPVVVSVSSPVAPPRHVDLSAFERTISLELMKKTVIDVHGHIFEQSEIMKIFGDEDECLCPLSNEVINKADLRPVLKLNDFLESCRRVKETDDTGAIVVISRDDMDSMTGRIDQLQTQVQRLETWDGESPARKHPQWAKNLSILIKIVTPKFLVDAMNRHPKVCRAIIWVPMKIGTICRNSP